VAAACAFDVIGVDCAAFEGCCGLFDEAGFVQGVAVQFALDVVFLADSASLVSGFPFSAFARRC
jgi:hypothetical protein